ncbi:pancreatic lipase-related protein 2-like [Dendropsophus ebraccatus]|uniref:pancreatic lipase-related protein 2-like n=1 Tax=Dendropsophus ebraccatus TaxID=150705 RepID=UPI0038316FEB
MRAQLLLVAAIVVAVRAGEEVCYDHLGCFTKAPPYSGTPQRPVDRYPWPPEKIKTRFLLFTRKNPDFFHEISALNVSTISSTKFCAKKKSLFIIHGFLESGEDKWLVDMCQTLLEVSDVNCFSVDWQGGSKARYTQAVNNVRVVGAEIAYFITYLLDHFKYPLSNIHLIGHSLGAHVAGEAGKRRPGIARISGLDPAGPFFEDTPPEVRLDPSDAVLVDVIHTDGSPFRLDVGFAGFGTRQLVGHLDFFPNGGKRMPGCPSFYRKLGNLDEVIEGVQEKIFCSHRRSVTLFLQSIFRPDGFISYPGSSYSAFQKRAGYTLFPCGWRYRVMVNLTGTTFFMGSFSVSLCGKEDCSPQYVIRSGFINSGKTYSSFIDVDMDIYPIVQVVFIWHNEATKILHPTLGVTAMAVQYGPSGGKSYFCVKGLTVQRSSQPMLWTRRDTVQDSIHKMSSIEGSGESVPVRKTTMKKKHLTCAQCGLNQAFTDLKESLRQPVVVARKRSRREDSPMQESPPGNDYKVKDEVYATSPDEKRIWSLLGAISQQRKWPNYGEQSGYKISQKMTMKDLLPLEGAEGLRSMILY